MAITQQITCDVCGKHKQDVNHWWMLSETYITGAFIAMPWDDKVNHLSIHACGQECAIKKLSEWMQDSLNSRNNLSAATQ